MQILATSTWERLDAPGTDSATVSRTGAELILSGHACFEHAQGMAIVDYELRASLDARSKGGRIYGSLNGDDFDVSIERRQLDWFVNGELQTGLSSLWDLDFGFTPATNFFLLRRLNLSVGERRAVEVVWFDLRESQLRAIAQNYERLSTGAYLYESPEFQYRGVIEVAPDGLVARYPKLWRALTSRA